MKAAFDGPYIAVSFTPFMLAGTNTLPVFLHPNPTAAPVRPPSQRYSIIETMPTQFSLAKNYPNPFNPTATIHFAFAELSIVTVKIYNVLARAVATHIDQANGAFEVIRIQRSARRKPRASLPGAFCFLFSRAEELP